MYRKIDKATVDDNNFMKNKVMMLSSSLSSFNVNILLRRNIVKEFSRTKFYQHSAQRTRASVATVSFSQ
jgi:hypothetical protein